MKLIFTTLTADQSGYCIVLEFFIYKKLMVMLIQPGFLAWEKKKDADKEDSFTQFINTPDLDVVSSG